MSTIYNFGGEWFPVSYNQQAECFLSARLGGWIDPVEMNLLVKGKVPHPSPLAVIRARILLKVEEP